MKVGLSASAHNGTSMPTYFASLPGLLSLFSKLIDRVPSVVNFSVNTGIVILFIPSRDVPKRVTRLKLIPYARIVVTVLGYGNMGGGEIRIDRKKKRRQTVPSRAKRENFSPLLLKFLLIIVGNG